MRSVSLIALLLVVACGGGGPAAQSTPPAGVDASVPVATRALDAMRAQSSLKGTARFGGSIVLDAPSPNLPSDCAVQGSVAVCRNQDYTQRFLYQRPVLHYEFKNAKQNDSKRCYGIDSILEQNACVFPSTVIAIVLLDEKARQADLADCAVGRCVVFKAQRQGRVGAVMFRWEFTLLVDPKTYLAVRYVNRTVYENGEASDYVLDLFDYGVPNAIPSPPPTPGP